MRVSLWPRFFATTISGTPAMTASEAHVWRRMWKVIAGAILARAHASFIGRAWSDRAHAPPPSRRNIGSLPARPAVHCPKNAELARLSAIEYDRRRERA